jgi:hypothetical protein
MGERLCGPGKRVQKEGKQFVGVPTEDHPLGQFKYTKKRRFECLVVPKYRIHNEVALKKIGVRGVRRKSESRSKHCKGQIRCKKV